MCSIRKQQRRVSHPLPDIDFLPGFLAYTVETETESRINIHFPVAALFKRGRHTKDFRRWTSVFAEVSRSRSSTRSFSLAALVPCDKVIGRRKLIDSMGGFSPKNITARVRI